MKTHQLNCSPVRPFLFAATFCWCSLGTPELHAQQYQYPPGYAPPRYTQQPRSMSNQTVPSVADRIKATGQNIGDFFKRSFYGENSRSVQKPQYAAQSRAPVGATPPHNQGRYSLDGPPVKAPATTGFQAPRTRDLPKYTPASNGKKSTAPVKSSSAVSRSSTSGSSKRYAPSKPSSFSKPAPKPRNETAPPPVPEEPSPPAPPSFPTEPAPTMPQPFQVESQPAPTIEARAKDTNYPLPGGLTPVPSDSPPSTTVETKPVANSSSSSSTTGASGSSFMVGKKTSKSGRVVSPYAPYNELDITGLPSGSLALDPTTQKVFQVP